MKIYIAGKITGESRASVAEKFASAMCKLKSAGHLPFNPSVLPDYEEVAHDDYMHVCYAMIDVCDAIYMLKDWQTSAGARAELQYAAEWKKKIIYEDENTREEGFPIVYGGWKWKHGIRFWIPQRCRG